MILTIRTDKPEAEIGLYDPSGTQISYHTWHAHRELSATILPVIRDQLAAKNATLDNLTGIVVYQGPGSFTGLRIGITVANTLAYSLQTPVVGTSGGDWQQNGIQQLHQGKNAQIVLPEYGGKGGRRRKGWS